MAALTELTEAAAPPFPSPSLDDSSASGNRKGAPFVTPRERRAAESGLCESLGEQDAIKRTQRTRKNSKKEGKRTDLCYRRAPILIACEPHLPDVESKTSAGHLQVGANALRVHVGCNGDVSRAVGGSKALEAATALWQSADRTNAAELLKRRDLRWLPKTSGSLLWGSVFFEFLVRLSV